MISVRSYYDKFFSVSNQKIETLQDFVRRVRSEKGLSTTQVEKNSLGQISSSYITRIENEPFKKVSTEKLSALAKGLGITEEEIFSIARGIAPDKDTISDERFNLISLKFHHLQGDKKRDAEALVRALERAVQES